MRLLKWPLNLKDKVFGFLVVVSKPLRLDPAYPHRIAYECACCRCGYVTTIARSSLLHLGVKSCATCAYARSRETLRLRSRAAAEAT